MKNNSWTYPNDLKKEDVKNLFERTKGKESKIIYIDPKTPSSIFNPLGGLNSSNPEHLKLENNCLEMVKKMNG